MHASKHFVNIFMRIINYYKHCKYSLVLHSEPLLGLYV